MVRAIIQQKVDILKKGMKALNQVLVLVVAMVIFRQTLVDQEDLSCTPRTKCRNSDSPLPDCASVHNGLCRRAGAAAVGARCASPQVGFGGGEAQVGARDTGGDSSRPRLRHRGRVGDAELEKLKIFLSIIPEMLVNNPKGVRRLLTPPLLLPGASVRPIRVRARAAAFIDSGAGAGAPRRSARRVVRQSRRRVRSIPYQCVCRCAA